MAKDRQELATPIEQMGQAQLLVLQNSIKAHVVWSLRSMAHTNTINESKVIKRNRVSLLLSFKNKIENASF